MSNRVRADDQVNVPNVNPAVDGQKYVAWGWVAFVAFLYMIGMATRPIRNYAYQFFYVRLTTLQLADIRFNTSLSGSSSSDVSSYIALNNKAGYGPDSSYTGLTV